MNEKSDTYLIRKRYKLVKCGHVSNDKHLHISIKNRDNSIHTLYVSRISMIFSQVTDLKWDGNRLSFRKVMNTDPSSSPCQESTARQQKRVYEALLQKTQAHTYLPPRNIPILLLSLLHKVHKNSKRDVLDPRRPDKMRLSRKVVVHRNLHKISWQVGPTW